MSFDFLSIFDGLLSATSAAKNASDLSDSDEESTSTKTDDRVEQTKADTHKIIEKRKHEIKERRTTQVNITDQHRKQHKR